MFWNYEECFVLDNLYGHKDKSKYVNTKKCFKHVWSCICFYRRVLKWLTARTIVKKNGRNNRYKIYFVHLRGCLSFPSCSKISKLRLWYFPQIFVNIQRIRKTSEKQIYVLTVMFCFRLRVKKYFGKRSSRSLTWQHANYSSTRKNLLAVMIKKKMINTWTIWSYAICNGRNVYLELEKFPIITYLSFINAGYVLDSNLFCFGFRACFKTYFLAIAFANYLEFIMHDLRVIKIDAWQKIFPSPWIYIYKSVIQRLKLWLNFASKMLI